MIAGLEVVADVDEAVGHEEACAEGAALAVNAGDFDPEFEMGVGSEFGVGKEFFDELLDGLANEGFVLGGELFHFEVGSVVAHGGFFLSGFCLLYTSPSPRDS